jgi:hypothetical protein
MVAMLRTSLKVVGAFVVLIASLEGWIAYRAYDAKTRVHAFCAGVSSGQSSQGLAQRARAQDLVCIDGYQRPAQEWDEPADSALLCCNRGPSALSERHVCEIHHRAGHVTRAQVVFVD